jgi:hypothetical protein
MRTPPTLPRGAVMTKRFSARYAAPGSVILYPRNLARLIKLARLRWSSSISRCSSRLVIAPDNR